MRRGFGFLWLALTLVIVGVVGVVSYQAGLATHLPADAAAVAPNYYYEPHFLGFGLFGALFFLFLLFLLFRVARFAAWGGRGWGGGGWKHGGYGGGVPPAMDERMQEWHKRAHSEPATAPPPDQKQA